MIYLTENTKVLLSIVPEDFRKQIDGFVSVCKNHLNEAPNSGTLFVFINKAKTMIRILSYQGNGYWLATKRLSRGRYTNWPNSTKIIHPLQASELSKIIKGIFETN
jgi:transposase